MPNPVSKIDVAGWVDRAKADPATYRQRQAAEIALNAIAITAPLNDKLFLKGGILMALAYDSLRQTGDIDLTADLVVHSDINDRIRRLLNSAFPRSAAALGYTDLIVKIHSVKRQPKGIFETAEFPALKLKVAYAQRGTRQEKALQEGKVPGVIDIDIDIDISFNEPMLQIQILELTEGRQLRAYSLIDLIAEKYRAMIQQVTRKRNRRQDVYDLHFLVAKRNLDDAIRAQILDAFVEKCRSRHIEPTRQSLEDPEVKTRSGVEWNTMELELGGVPDFEECFERVFEFYRSLPWNS